MLQITRKRGEKFTIGDNIEITVDYIQKNYNVALSIKAPKNMKILRNELLHHDRQPIRQDKPQ